MKTMNNISASWQFQIVPAYCAWVRLRSVSSPKRRIFLVIFLSFFQFLVNKQFCYGSEAQGKLPTAQTIRKVWEDRATSIRSARFVWTQRQEMPRRLLANVPLHLLRDGGAALPIDAKGTHVSETTCTFLVKGAKMRFEVVGNVPSRTSPNQLAPIDWLSVFDGNIYKKVRKQDSSIKIKHQGILERGKNFILEADMGLLPLLWNLRPQKMGLAPERFKFTSEEKDGRSLVVLTDSASKRQKGYRLDPSRNYAIVQLKAVGEQVDILFIQDENAGWLPTAWNFIMPRGENEFTIVTCKVTEYAINENIEDSQFVMDFPPGTVVSDLEGNRVTEKYINSPRSRIFWLVTGIVALIILVLFRIFRLKWRSKNASKS